MIWVYIDESGEHDPSGRLHRLTLGGCIAPYENWEQLTPLWQDALDRVCVSVFHMTEFEADRGEFKGWKKNRPEDRAWLLNTLLGLIVDHVPALIAFSEDHTEHGPSVKQTYDKGIVDSLRHFIADRNWPEEPFALVYAKHPEYPRAILEERFGSIGEGDAKLRCLAVLEPAEALPLQAADLVAYEFSRQQRANRPERYPFTRLRNGVSSMRLIYV
jgi:hypothetical protein